jgi:S-adenosylmethionine synthetase
MRFNVASSSYLFTSESVSEGHPDKICDQVSDAIVDAFFAEDPYSRVALETLATTNRLVLAGEVRGPASIDAGRMEDIARGVVKRIGYEQKGFNWKTLDVSCYVHEQSAHIAQGVDASGNKDEGAGDQGIMFGFAVNETPELMPAPLTYAHKILKNMAAARHSGAVSQFGPDAKSQVTLKYENGKPVGVSAVVVSTQHVESVSQHCIRDLVRPFVCPNRCRSLSIPTAPAPSMTTGSATCCKR